MNYKCCKMNDWYLIGKRYITYVWYQTFEDFKINFHSFINFKIKKKSAPYSKCIVARLNILKIVILAYFGLIVPDSIFTEKPWALMELEIWQLIHSSREHCCQGNTSKWRLLSPRDIWFTTLHLYSIGIRKLPSTMQ